MDMRDLRTNFLHTRKEFPHFLVWISQQRYKIARMVSNFRSDAQTNDRNNYLHDMGNRYLEV